MTHNIMNTSSDIINILLAKSTNVYKSSPQVESPEKANDRKKELIQKLKQIRFAQLQNQDPTQKLIEKKDDPFVKIFLSIKKQRHLGKKISYRNLKLNKNRMKNSRKSSHGSCDSYLGHIYADSSEHQRERQQDIERLKKSCSQLPTNVQQAIMVAAKKKKHSDYFYRLSDLNDKIHIFTKMFYGKQPQHEMRFTQRRKEQQKEKLKQ